jgi:hypothetical protein
LKLLEGDISYQGKKIFYLRLNEMILQGEVDGKPLPEEKISRLEGFIESFGQKPFSFKYVFLLRLFTSISNICFSHFQNSIEDIEVSPAPSR